VRQVLLSLGRALRLRCPVCGRGALFRGFLQPRERCPACGFRLEREDGYYLGAMLLNVIVAELLFVVGFAIALLRTWPNPPWTLLTVVSMVGVALLPILLYPFSRSVWLAPDLVVQPPRAEEFDAPPAAPTPDEQPSGSR
jgi:uncharacterized protein (DUF983 family)